MTARLAFIRGINVGGNRQLPMAELRRTMSERGFGNVRTYIQSGNVVYDAPAGSNDAPGTLHGEGAQITAAIEDTRGFAPEVMVRSADAVAAALAESPYRDEDPAKTFLVFVDGDAAALGDLAAAATSGERWQVGDGVIHLHCPDGLGRSKLGAKFAASAKVPTTTRNLRTIAKLLDLASS
jgi:uncharacterized protein (DUF1697 family)